MTLPPDVTLWFFFTGIYPEIPFRDSSSLAQSRDVSRIRFKITLETIWILVRSSYWKNFQNSNWNTIPSPPSPPPHITAYQNWSQYSQAPEREDPLLGPLHLLVSGSPRLRLLVYEAESGRSMGSILQRSTPDQRGCPCRRIFGEALLSSASLSTSSLAPSLFRKTVLHERGVRREMRERGYALRYWEKETENDVLMISQRGSRLRRVLSDSSGIRGARLWASLSASGPQRWGQVLLTVERSLVLRRWCRGSSDTRRSGSSLGC